jgi:hypothetical protein
MPSQRGTARRLRKQMTPQEAKIWLRLRALRPGAGHEVVWDDAIPGLRRFYASDPVGNRIEFLQDAK